MGKIYVTQPALPPLDEFTRSLEKIWESKILSNNGPFHQEFEKELADYLGVKYISVFSNGTIALVTALQALNITGEVITTPFSFVATTHSLWWNNIKPVFVDVESQFFNLDPDKVEAAITPKTTAIMPVHVYGNPCNVERFKHIADTYGLKLIYDAAHAFGVKIKNNSVLNFGDLSILSFHATKVFNTIEGGAIVCHDLKMKQRVDLLKNFGFEDETHVIEPGINGKLNEIQSAYGLLQLKYIDDNIAKRKAIHEIYKTQLADVLGITCLPDPEECHHSHSYFPILVDETIYGISRDALYEKFKKEDIFVRRYFYPLISHFPTYSALPSAAKDNLPVSEKVASQILCLPIYPKLTSEDLECILIVIKGR